MSATAYFKFSQLTSSYYFLNEGISLSRYKCSEEKLGNLKLHVTRQLTCKHNNAVCKFKAKNIHLSRLILLIFNAIKVSNEQKLLFKFS